MCQELEKCFLQKLTGMPQEVEKQIPRVKIYCFVFDAGGWQFYFVCDMTFTTVP